MAINEVPVEAVVGTSLVSGRLLGVLATDFTMVTLPLNVLTGSRVGLTRH